MEETRRLDLLQLYPVSNDSLLDCSVEDDINDIQVTVPLQEWPFDNKILWRLCKNSRVHIVGIVNVQAIWKAVDIMGYKLTTKNGPETIFSMTKIEPLSISTVDDYQETVDEVEFEKHLKSCGVPSHIIKECTIDDYLIIFTRSSREKYLVEVLQEYFSFPKYPKSIPPDKPCEFLNYSNFGFKILKMSSAVNVFPEEFKKTVENIIQLKLNNQPPRVIIFGGQRVGKSTFMRHLINHCLNKYPKVMVLDFDPGQSEFTISGCISVVSVEKPLLGPPYTHVTIPDRYWFVGNIAVSESDKVYENTKRNAISFVKNECTNKSIPWIVNTAGLTKGGALQMAFELIRKIVPTDVVDIRSKDRVCNFPSDFFQCLLDATSPAFIYKEKIGADSYNNHGFYMDDLILSYNLHTLNSAVSRAGIPRSSNSSDKRGMMTVAYFSKCFIPVEDDSSYYITINNRQGRHLYLNSIKPLRLKLGRVRVKSMANISDLKSPGARNTVNGNLVALEVKREDVDAQCVGFGLVRGLSDTHVYVSTPVPKNIFKMVNMFSISGAVQLPWEVYIKQQKYVNGRIPYIVEGAGNCIGKPFKRTQKRNFSQTLSAPPAD